MEINKKMDVKKLTKVAILCALSTVLMFVEFPIPLFPPFLKLDFSDFPVLIGGFAFGPVTVVVIAVVKNVLHILLKGSESAGVGQIANLIITIAFVVPASVIYKHKRTKKGAIIGLIVSIISIMVVGAIANKYILIPFYAQLYMPMDQIIAVANKINHNITSIDTYVMWGSVPFNLLKGVILSVVTLFTYKHLSFLYK